jgi:DNA primase
LKLISLKIPAVCTFGSTLGEVQVGKIANSGFERVLIAYDGDEAGRKGALGAHRSLHPYKPTQIVNFPVGRDPGDLVSAGQFNELLEGGKSVDLVG